MKLLTHIPAFLKNKYFLSFAIFGVVILFLDKNDFFAQLDRRRELKELEQSKQHYTKEIAAERKELEALKNNPATLEKYAREKYYMKRDNEELFLISENPDLASGETKK
ncbi:MAG: septum formation initiator family protein [Chitinophagaceae bacterium]